MRMELFEKWVKLGYDGEIVARAANRLGSDTSWKSNRAHTYLSFALTKQLECEVNDGARPGIMAIIHGFYVGSSESIKEVKVVE